MTSLPQSRACAVVFHIYLFIYLFILLAVLLCFASFIPFF